MKSLVLSVLIEGLWMALWSSAVDVGRESSTLNLCLLVVVPRMADAIVRTRTEREQVTAERAAFEQFAKRVAALDPKKQTALVEYGSPAVTGTGLAVVNHAGGDESALDSEATSLASVQKTYRETVMAVPHYEEEYDESLAENLAAELGPSLAQSLVEGDVLTPQLQRAILDQTRQARKQRTTLLNQVESEYDTLIEERRRLRDLYDTATTIEEDRYPRPVRELVQSWNRLEELATDCETVLRERQTHIQTKKGQMSMLELYQYLYEPFPWRHPILNDGLDTLTRIQCAKRKVLKAIYNW